MLAEPQAHQLKFPTATFAEFVVKVYNNGKT